MGKKNQSKVLKKESAGVGNIAFFIISLVLYIAGAPFAFIVAGFTGRTALFVILGIVPVLLVTFAVAILEDKRLSMALPLGLLISILLMIGLIMTVSVPSW